jgi:hypothetical protein
MGRFLKSPHIADVMERHGVPIGQTDVRKAVCLNLASTGHGFGFSGQAFYLLSAEPSLKYTDLSKIAAGCFEYAED